MLMPTSARGLTMAERTPTAENSSFASTVNALQPASHVTAGGTMADGQTIDNSCAVRVTDTSGLDKKLNHAGIAASAGSRTMDNSPSSSLRTRSSSRNTTRYLGGVAGAGVGLAAVPAGLLTALAFPG